MSFKVKLLKVLKIANCKCPLHFELLSSFTCLNLKCTVTFDVEITLNFDFECAFQFWCLNILKIPNSKCPLNSDFEFTLNYGFDI